MNGLIYPPPRRIEKRRLEARQAAASGSSPVEASTTAAQQTTTAASTTTPAATTTTPAASSPSSSAPAVTTTTPAAQSSSTTVSTTTAASTTTTTTAAPTSTSSSASSSPTTTTTTTPTAAVSSTSPSVIVSVVEVTFTNSGGSVQVSSATSSIKLQSSASASPASHSSSGLSSGARAGVIAGSVVGGVAILALILAACLLVRRKRKNDLNDKDQIRWPELAATAEDRAALYPETTHRTGRAGVGEDGDMEQIDGASAYSSAAGAGVAGVGAGALAGRYPSQSSNSRQPTLPQIAPSIYDSENGYGQGAVYPPSQSHYASTQGHAQGNYLGAGPASIDYYARQNQTPSPPRNFGDESSTGHDGPVSTGHHQAAEPQYAPDEPQADGRSSPQPMQVGGAFGSGYDESDGGKRWRLSVVNDDRE